MSTVCRSPGRANHTPRYICMLAYTFYEFDNRVRRYAEALAGRGDRVDVIALRRASQPEQEMINGVCVYRIQARDHNEKSKWTYATRLLRFLVRSSLFLTKLHRKNCYDLIHIHNMPDFLVYAAWRPKLTGAKLILDIHDMVPELFGDKFRGKFNSFYLGFLKAIERWSAAFVNHVIVSNDLWRDTLVNRSVATEKCTVFLNHVDQNIFYRREKTRRDNRFIVLFPGTLQWHQGLDIAIRAFAEFSSKISNAEFHVYSGGGGGQKAALMELSRSLGLGERVKFFDAVALEKIPEVIANADLGVVPKRADSFGDQAFSTKIMEFMSQGLPVVASRTKIDSYYFDEKTVHFFRSGDSSDMARAMLEVVQNEELRGTLIRRGYDYSEQNGWQRKKQAYLDLVDRLSSGNSHSGDLVREEKQEENQRTRDLKKRATSRSNQMSIPLAMALKED